MVAEVLVRPVVRKSVRTFDYPQTVEGRVDHMYMHAWALETCKL